MQNKFGKKKYRILVYCNIVLAFISFEQFFRFIIAIFYKSPGGTSAVGCPCYNIIQMECFIAASHSFVCVCVCVQEKKNQIVKKLIYWCFNSAVPIHLRTIWESMLLSVLNDKGWYLTRITSKIFLSFVTMETLFSFNTMATSLLCTTMQLSM